jgi:hypothetical protein
MKMLTAVLLAVLMIGIPFEIAAGATTRVTRGQRTARSVAQASKKISAARTQAKKQAAVRTRAALRKIAAERIAAAKQIAARRRAAAAK